MWACSGLGGWKGGVFREVYATATTTKKSGMDACRPIASLSVCRPFYSFIRQGKLLLHGHSRFGDILFVPVALGMLS